MWLHYALARDIYLRVNFPYVSKIRQTCKPIVFGKLREGIKKPEVLPFVALEGSFRDG